MNLNEINLNRLVAFAAVVEAGSLTAAARRLGLAKTMVSKHMQLLEAELGVGLLLRSTRKLTLTEAGLAFYEASRDLLKAADAAVEAARGGIAAPRGLLRVTAPVDYGTLVVAPLLAGLRQRYPALTVELICADQVLDLIGGGIDVAVRLGKLADSSHQAARVGGFVKWPVASPAFIARHGAPDSIEQLQRLPFIAHTVLAPPLQFTLGAPRQPVRLVRMAAAGFSCNTVDGCRAAALAGEGVACLTDFAVQADLQAGRLLRLLPPWATPPDSIHAVFPASAHLPQKVRVLINALKAAGAA